MLTKEEDQTVVAWTLGMQECGLFITLQQLKMKVAKVTQTRPTPFKNGMPIESWWHWFQNRHPNISIKVVETLEVSRAQGLTTNSYNTSYNNLQTLFS
jgi:hypothetical protein